MAVIDLDSAANLQSRRQRVLPYRDVTREEADDFELIIQAKVGCSDVAGNVGLACREI